MLQRSRRHLNWRNCVPESAARLDVIKGHALFTSLHQDARFDVKETALREPLHLLQQITDLSAAFVPSNTLCP
jgi:hypothetical protein